MLAELFGAEWFYSKICSRLIAIIAHNIIRAFK